MTHSPVSPHRVHSALKTVAVGLLILHFALGWSLRAPGVTLGGDDATYVLLGRALRHLDYGSAWLPGAPLHGQYPPVYPAVLALSGATGAGRAGIGVVLNLLLSTAALGVFALLCWRWSPVAAVAAVGVAAVNPTLLRLAGVLMSDPLFMLLLSLTLWCAVTRPNRWPLAVLGAIAAALTRSIGVAVIAGLLIDWARTRRWRPALGLGVAALLTVGPWFIRAASVPQQLAGQSYIGDALSRRKASPESRQSIRPPGAIPLLVSRVGSNTGSYLGRTLPSVLVVPTLPGTKVDNVAWLIVLIGLGIVGTMAILRRDAVVPIVVGCYVGVLILWPYVVGRFLAPVLPLLVFVVLVGAWRLGERIPRIPSWVPVAVFAGVLMITGLQADRREIQALAHCDRARPYDTDGCFSPDQRAFLETLADANRLSPAGAVFLTPKPSVVYYLTGHVALDDVFAASLGPDELDAYLRRNGVDFALLSRVHTRSQAFGAALRPRCDEWRLMVNRESAGSVLLSRREGSDTTASSCEVLGRIDLTGR